MTKPRGISAASWFAAQSFNGRMDTNSQVSCGVGKVPEPTGALTGAGVVTSCSSPGGSDERTWPKHIAAPPAGINLADAAPESLHNHHHADLPLVGNKGASANEGTEAPKYDGNMLPSIEASVIRAEERAKLFRETTAALLPEFAYLLPEIVKLQQAANGIAVKPPRDTAKLTALGSVIGCTDLVMCQDCKEPVERLYQCDECGDSSPLRCWQCADDHAAEPHWTDSKTSAERGW